MSGRPAVWVLAMAVLSATAAATMADMEEVSLVRLTVETEIDAPPAQVWAHITTGKSLVTWYRYWRGPGNSRINISKVGDVLEFEDEWGNAGRSVVTYLDRNKEIRVAHEPHSGSYVCQAKLILEPSETGTFVIYVEQYSDESSEEDMEATADEMDALMRDTLAALKKGVEAKP